MNILDRTACEKPICWETSIGQELYKLTVMDLGVQAMIIFMVDLPRVLIFGRCSSGYIGGKLGSIEFGISKNVLDLVYSQAICWIGIFYSPLIVAVTVVKSIILYYFRIFYVLYVSRSHLKMKRVIMCSSAVVHALANTILRIERLILLQILSSACICHGHSCSRRDHWNRPAVIRMWAISGH